MNVNILSDFLDAYLRVNPNISIKHGWKGQAIEEALQFYINGHEKGEIEVH